MNYRRQLIALLLTFATLFSLSAEALALSFDSPPEEDASSLSVDEPDSDLTAEDPSSDEDISGSAPAAPEDSDAPDDPDSSETPDDPDGSDGSESPEDQSPAEPGDVSSPEPEEGTEEPAAGSEDQTETDPADPDAAASEDPEGTPLPEDAQDIPFIEQTPSYELEITEEYALTLQYDDRYSFDDLLDGYAIISTETNQVTSYQVSQGKKTSSLDSAILRPDGDSDVDVIACGIGKATVLLAKEDEAELALKALNQDVEPADAPQELQDGSPAVTDAAKQPQVPAQKVSVVQVQVTVEPATLTMLFVAGQSNAEGYCSSSAGYHPEDSIACPEGQVYSTYAPRDNNSAHWITGLSSFSGYTTADGASFIAGSLAGSESLSGSTLIYPLNALTQAGKGKTGPDSGLAYQWNRLTGDKVWVINAAVGASYISSWTPDGVNYMRAKTIFQDCISTMKAEVAAGHYVAGNRLLFWLQGEADRRCSTDYYLSAFDTMQAAFTADCGIQYFGIIMVRASFGSYTSAEDLYMTGPRIAQYYMANSSSYPNVYVVSNANEQWVTNSGVSSYFNSAYPGGSLTYPRRENSTLSGLPTTVQAVHSDIHYAQVAHNENGLTAAQTMYEIVKGVSASRRASVSWLDSSGQAVSALDLVQGMTCTLFPVVSPLCLSKQVTVSAGTGLSYDAVSGTLTGKSVVSSSINAYISNKSLISTLPVTISPLETPTLKSIANAQAGVTLTWQAVPYASQYRVYRKTSGSGWEMLGAVTGTSYTDEETVSGTNYTYTVRAGLNDSWSDYDHIGLSICYLATPALSISRPHDGVLLSWKTVSGATYYRIFRRSNGGSWSALTTVKSGSITSYLDTDLNANTTYEYTIRSYSASSHSAFSAILSYDSLKTPALVSAVNHAGKVLVSWKAVSGAAGYYVYRKTPSSGWEKIAKVTGGSATSYGDTTVSNKITYIYTVRAYKGTSLSSYSSSGVQVTYLKAPVISAAANTASGVKISWNAVSGATSYLVYRKTASTVWSMLATVTGTSYTDTSSLSSGTTYTYTVRAKNSAAISGYYAGQSIIWLSVPPLASAVNTTSGIQVSWKAVSGAAGYRLYRRTPEGSWSMIATLTGSSATSYTDTAVSNRTTYIYTVRAFSGSTLSYYNSSGVQVTCLKAPAVSAAVNTASGIQVTWNKISGAASYVVYRKTPSTGWSKLATVTGTSYTDSSTLSSGTTYTYTVRAQTSTALSGYYSGLSVVRLSIPSLTGAVNTNSGIQVSWKAVSGATGYYLYRKTATGSWSKLATLSGKNTVTYTDTSAVSGTTYYYTVRACNGSTLSYYDRSGVSVIRLAAPALNSATASKGKIQVSWSKSAGATSYMVYRKTASSGWTMLGTVTGTSYTDTSSLSSGTAYTYTVRAVRGSTRSDYVRTGITATAK